MERGIWFGGNKSGTSVSDRRPPTQNRILMNPLTETLNRRSPASPAQVGFWSLAVVALTGTNQFLHLTVGTGWLGLLGLATCCVLLCLVVRIPLRRAAGLPGLLIVATLFSYLLIGLSGSFVTSLPWFWYAADPVFPLRIILAALIVVATALGASATSYRVSVERLLKGILAILAVVCILILMTPPLRDYLYTPPPHLIDIRWIARHRFVGPFANPNMAGIVCCYTVVLALFFLASGRHRTFAGIVLLLGTVAGILTLSKLVILTLLIIFIFFLCYLILRYRQKRLSVAWWLIVIIVGAIVSAMVNIEHFPLNQRQIRRVTGFQEILPSAAGGSDIRWVLWPVALSQITESPFFGHGLLRFHFLEGSARCRLGERCGSHNSYLMLWGEAGAIPLVLFLLFIGSLLWKSLAHPRAVTILLVVPWSIVFVLACMTNDTVIHSPPHVFVLGLSCALVASATWESGPQNQGQR